jgi:predicted nucleic acid-binding protein
VIPGFLAKGVDRPSTYAGVQGLTPRPYDHALRLTNCASFALMRRLRLTQAVALDADFRSFGLHCLPASA